MRVSHFLHDFYSFRQDLLGRAEANPTLVMPIEIFSICMDGCVVRPTIYILVDQSLPAGPCICERQKQPRKQIESYYRNGDNKVLVESIVAKARPMMSQHRP